MFHEWQLTIISHTFWHFIPQNLFESLKVDTLHLMCLYIETWGKTWYTLNPYNTWKYFSRPSHISNLFSTCATFCCTCGDNVVHMWSYNRKIVIFLLTPDDHLWSDQSSDESYLLLWIYWRVAYQLFGAYRHLLCWSVKWLQSLMWSIFYS